MAFIVSPLSDTNFSPYIVTTVSSHLLDWKSFKYETACNVSSHPDTNFSPSIVTIVSSVPTLKSESSSFTQSKMSSYIPSSEYQSLFPSEGSSRATSPLQLWQSMIFMMTLVLTMILIPSMITILIFHEHYLSSDVSSLLLSEGSLIKSSYLLFWIGLILMIIFDFSSIRFSYTVSRPITTFRSEWPSMVCFMTYRQLLRNCTCDSSELTNK